ncbi:hypothetical protein ABW20_dc0100248 [Dactylellina cionopaga]|nr:hypothetical protein ABW20_dc0100248 [Dactylellina cionopaga]
MPAFPVVPATSTTGEASVLQSGNYYISSAANARIFLSRPQAEDRSLLPKKVLTSPKGSDVAPWTINKQPDGTYTLENKGALAIEINGQLFAQFEDQPPKLQPRWKITSVNQAAFDQFM